MEQELLVIGQMDIESFFTKQDNMDVILNRIRESALSEIQSTETAKSRKAIASMAHKVSQSKVMLDNAGKDLVSEWKLKTKKIDEARKQTRDFLDNLRDEVRKPLTDWEIAEQEKEEKRIADEVLSKAWESAKAEDELFERQKAIEAKEAEFARQQAEREAEEARQREIQEAQERERREAEERRQREERIKQQAIEQAKIQAKKEAEEKERQVQKEKEEAARKIKQAEEAKIKAEQDRVAAIARAEVEKEMAVEEAKRKEQEAEERRQAEQKAEAERLRVLEEKRVANVEHRRKINREILVDMMDVGDISELQAMNIIDGIVEGEIRHFTINY